MVSPELLRRYPFFAGLSMKHITALAQAAAEQDVAAGTYLFHEGVELHHIYLVTEGNIAIVMELPARNIAHRVADQLTGEMQTEDVVVSNVGAGEVFGWSGLLPPHQATAGAKAVSASKVVALNRQQLTQLFAEDAEFGYLMTQKVAGVIRQRLQDMRIESLAHMAV